MSIIDKLWYFSIFCSYLSKVGIIDRRYMYLMGIRQYIIFHGDRNWFHRLGINQLMSILNMVLGISHTFFIVIACSSQLGIVSCMNKHYFHLYGDIYHQSTHSICHLCISNNLLLHKIHIGHCVGNIQLHNRWHIIRWDQLQIHRDKFCIVGHLYMLGMGEYSRSIPDFRSRYFLGIYYGIFANRGQKYRHSLCIMQLIRIPDNFQSMPNKYYHLQNI